MVSTLLLNATFEPMKVISWQRAIVLLVLGKAELVEAYDDVVRGKNHALQLPSVVRLRRYARQDRRVKFSRTNVYRRDGFACQYCGAQPGVALLTLDHVLPRAQGGRTEWTNIVTACHDCNRKKGGRTPRQAGMVLRVPPVQPDWVPAVTIRVSLRSVPDAWRDYLYWTGELVEE
jgi:5-methylcytosine-specific restriction endonuclease McrA